MHTFASIHINSSLNSGTLCIYNMLGNKMRTIEQIFGQTITIQREQLAAGFYLIQLTEGARVIGEKIIEIVD
ncbi:MAG: T9SS type A sorting domain-containing protein [Saprospiraceae bacterium]|uniref:T9SS type A sorting domain-containing protein n=1 Tax=Candidatus Defluviibacterium haderslevense TaxID=2981993 RepID=A0A9D7S9C2_9BACT|nr:T9SS type A sorting domain-containing protein [Candidatus Defluviibacterium haderslevense]